jgi:hypothetical protein
MPLALQRQLKTPGDTVEVEYRKRIYTLTVEKQKFSGKVVYIEK